MRSSTSLLSSRSRRLLGVSLLFVFPLLGCSNEIHRSNWADETPQARAKAITNNTRKAARAVERYRESQDIEDLLAAVEHARISTEISPGQCKSCYRLYGVTLSALGHHYRRIYEETLDDLDVAESAQETADLQEEADEYRRQMEENFRKSNQAFRYYFANPEVAVVPVYDYERVMRHHEYLGEYEEALYYLENAAVSAMAGKTALERQRIAADVDTLRRFYKRRIQDHRERTYRRSIEGGPEAGTSRTPRRLR